MNEPVMNEPAVYLYEFLYRGRAPDSIEAPDYHVILAQRLTDAFGNTTISMSSAMAPDQAKAEGFDLPAVAAAINGALLAENAGLKRDLAAARAAAENVTSATDGTMAS